MINFIKKICLSCGRMVCRGGMALLIVSAVVFNLFLAAFAESSAREFPVQIVHDGERSVCMMAGGRVEDALEKAGIEVGEYDVVTPAPQCIVEKGDIITIKRRELVERVEREEIPYETVEVPTSILKEGVRKTINKGRAGSKVTTYVQMHEDGKPIEEERKQGKTVVTQPLTEKVMVGTPGAAVSPLEFDIPLDENGVPQSCRSIMKGRRAAGYSARPGAGTASGRPAAVGHVAVNPHVIPYGTKLYIRSADGEFVYGYAIAADTGTALMQGIIDLDLFYATYEESALNGIRTVDIYILE